MNEDILTCTDEELAIMVAEPSNPLHIGRAKAETEHRRRQWEEEQAATRRKFEIEMFNAAADNEVKRKQFDAAQLDKQMAHAERLAAEQITAAVSSAKATRLAAWAAGLSALGAVVSAIIALEPYFQGN